MSFIDYRAWIKTSLESLSTIKNVADFVSETSEDYPFAVIEAGDTDADITSGTNRRVRRNFQFLVTLYGLYEQEEKTKSEQETLFLTAVDQVINFFDNPDNWHTTGNDNRVHLSRGKIDKVSEPKPMRKCEFEITIFKLSP